MADKPPDTHQTASKPEAQAGKSDRLEVLVSILSGVFGHKIGDALITGLINLFSNRMEKSEDRPKHLITFGEALTKLKAVAEYAYDVINDFMRVSLTKDADRNDFQVRTAKMGGDNIDVTVAFLQLVAAEPDHESRKNFLESLGIIGERAIDPIERATLVAKKAGAFIERHGPEVLAWIEEDFAVGAAEFDQFFDEDYARQQAILAEINADLARPLSPRPTQALRNWWAGMVQRWRDRDRGFFFQLWPFRLVFVSRRNTPRARATVVTPPQATNNERPRLGA
jgi:hypothetical protein